MRLIARMPDARQAGFLVDSLRNSGFDRKDMIISGLAGLEEHRPGDPGDVAGEIAFVKTEREGLWETGAFAGGIEGFNPEGKRGILVAVETPKRGAGRVRAMMEQAGAVEIIQD
ncbi:MAG: hypothetical protein K6T80_01710 [Firmicutes bacterium]|nr:hypothetical protein [Bacillota bacterium]